MVYNYLEHTADILFEAEGDTFEEALEEAAAAMSNATVEKFKKKIEFEFEEKAKNIEELTVAVLSRLLSESEVEGLFPGGLKVLKFEEKTENFRMKVKGWAGTGTQKADIKAVTYHMLKIERNEKCKIRILLDV